MSSVYKRIRDGIQAISGHGTDGAKVYIASVDSVDINARTCSCTLISGDATMSLTTVNLMAEPNDGLLYSPTVGSTVMIESHDNITPYITMWSQLDSIFYVAGGSMFEIDNTGLKLNISPVSGAVNYGGIIKLVDPSNSAIGLLARMNKMENNWNAFVEVWNAFCLAYVPGSPTVTGLPATLASSTATEVLPITQRSDLENTTVQHGNGS